MKLYGVARHDGAQWQMRDCPLQEKRANAQTIADGLNLHYPSLKYCVAEIELREAENGKDT